MRDLEDRFKIFKKERMCFSMRKDNRWKRSNYLNNRKI